MRSVKKLQDLDWSRWRPVDLATLLFVIRDGEILLIRKKRGLGKGKINGPGGRLEPGEDPEDGAIREVEEEVCVVPRAVRRAGELLFQFTDGYSIHVHVFTARDCIGEPRETDEALPRWYRVSDIPYEEMWADDVIWIPRMLAGERFFGRFLFDGDVMMDHSVESGSGEGTGR
jgi:8-oxo-dGTP diphosphatase